MENDKYNVLNLKSQICYPLYACSRLIIKRYKSLLDPLGLTYTQYLVMMVLWENGSMSVRSLGDKLELDSGTLTPLLKKLERKGLVTRCRSAVDERMLIVTASEEGMKLRDLAVDIPASLDASLPFTKEERDQLYSLLYKIIESENDLPEDQAED